MTTKPKKAKDITPKDFTLIPSRDKVKTDDDFVERVGGFGGPLVSDVENNIETVNEITETAFDGSYNLITDVINARLNSATKKILSDFDFGVVDYAGAVKAGDISWDINGENIEGSGVAIYRKGIVGANEGVVTFSIDAETGDATFAGTLSAATGTLGAITVGSNAWHVDANGNMWWGSSTTYASATIKISSAGSVNFTTGTFTGAIIAGAGSQIPNLYTYDEFTAGENLAGKEGYAVYQMYIEGTGVGTPPQTENRPTSTNDVWENTPTTNYKDMSSLTFCGITGNHKHAYMIFNLSSLPTTAEKVLFHFKSNTITGTANYNLSIGKVSASYDPDTVNWNTKPASTGTYGTVNVIANNTWYSIDITTLYNEWTAGDNYGMIVNTNLPDSPGILATIWGYYGGSGGDSPYLEVWGPSPTNIGRVYLAKADNGYTCGTFVGFITTGATTGNTVRIQTSGIISASSLPSVPSYGPVYISDSDFGKIVSSAPTFPMAIGECISEGVKINSRRTIRKIFTGKYATGFKPIACFPTDPTLASNPTVTYNTGSVAVSANAEYVILG